MFWIALAATTQLSAPVPKDLPTLFTADDVPDYLIAKRSGLWFVKVRVSVRPDAKVEGCDIEASSGIPDLDKFTCRRILTRAGFIPARWADGTAAFGVYRTSIKWIVADSPWDTSRVGYPDLDIKMQRLPAGAQSPTSVRVMFNVDQTGNMSSCEAEPTKPFEHIDNNPTLVPVACEQLSKNYKPVPAKDTSGNTIPSVQDAEVRFTGGL